MRESKGIHRSPSDVGRQRRSWWADSVRLEGNKLPALLYARQIEPPIHGLDVTSAWLKMYGGSIDGKNESPLL